MAATRVGIIGGTGLGEALAGDSGGERVTVDTPFGPPSSQLILAQWEGVDVVFLSRHGLGHMLSPSNVPYRANIWALKKLGVSAILASGATGSLRENINPGHLVLCDQVIDKTFRRAGTFFDDGLAVHVELAEPFCPRLRSLLAVAGRHVDTMVHPAGTYVCMEGPQFSTRAESRMHRQWGGDLIGMTCMPEAKLAREAQICYALIAMPTDYDCWRESDTVREHDELLREILGNLRHATETAIALIRKSLQQMKDDAGAGCGCSRALKLAIWSDKKRIDDGARTRYGLLMDGVVWDAEAPGTST